MLRVIAPPAPDAAALTGISNSVGEQVGRELMTAYTASLRNRAEVKINRGRAGEGRVRRGPRTESGTAAAGAWRRGGRGAAPQ